MKPLKILYASGPVDAGSVYRHWLKGEVDPQHCTIPFVHQFYDLCQELDAEAYVISRSPRPDHIQDGNFTIDHRPVPFQHGHSALAYYFGQLLVGLQLIVSTLTFRPDVLVIQNGRVFPFFLSPIAWLGVDVIPSYHCVLWAKYKPKTRAQSAIFNWSRRLFEKDCAAVLSTSKDITEQIKQLTSGQGRPITEFLSIYQPHQFKEIEPPTASRNPFNVLFVGRMNDHKGIFDLLEIAQRFRQLGHDHIRFDLCGTGPDLERLKMQVSKANLEDTFTCHGHCNRPRLVEKYAQAHVVIVPTTTRFQEGLNQVVLEGILSGRPVITSAVCPAIHYVREAVVEVDPDDVKGYGDAILTLCDDQDFYTQKYEACLSLQSRFYDLSEGWGEKLKAILQAHGTIKS